MSHWKQHLFTEDGGSSVVSAGSGMASVVKQKFAPATPGEGRS